MFKTNLKIAWRSLIKDKQFVLLNVLGLSAGLVCVLLIFLWVKDEMSIDKKFANDSRLFQIMEKRTGEGQSPVSDESSGIVSDLLRTGHPEVQYAAAVAPPDWFQQFTLSAGEKNIKGRGQYVGKDYFNIFSFKLVDGNRNKLLADNNSIVISDEIATKLFGTTENLIGKPIRFQHDTTFYVSGVFEKTAPSSSQQFDFVLSFEYYASMQSWVKSWSNTGPHNFVLLAKGTDVNAFNRSISKLVVINFKDTSRSLFASRFSDNYLLHSFSHGVALEGRMQYIRLFSLIAAFILCIACINFMNLSTARAARRMKEVGIKKVAGAKRSQLIFQFLSESVLLTAIAMIVALFLASLLLPFFNHLTGKVLSLEPDRDLIVAAIIIFLFTGLLAGSYPALYLSKFKPLTVLKGKLRTSVAELVSRTGLVIFQFSLSAIMIVAVIIIYQQIQFIQSTDPGYDKDNIVRIDAEGALLGKEDVFIDALKKQPGIVNCSFTYNNIVGRNYGNYDLSWDGRGPNEQIYFEGFGVGPDFIETMDMHLSTGRGFSKDFGDDYGKILLNEAGVRVMHLQDPVGKTIHLGNTPLQIIGVIKDFHFESLHEAVKPAYFTLQRVTTNPWNKFIIRIQAGHQKEALASIQRLSEQYNPGFPFVYNFLDEAYEKQYDNEKRISSLSTYFAGLAIIISCLGLFGLTAFTAQKRQKEIGIRKVIGASVTNITTMLSKDFCRHVIIALVISFPVSWWLMHRWLQGFAYHVAIGAGVFIVAGMVIILITLLTISYQSIKAAIANPVKSLRAD